MIRVTDLVVGYHGREVARIPNLDIGPDRVWIVSGPNGSGKTTLLKTLAGLLPPIAGAIGPAPAPGRGGAVFVHSTPVLFAGTVRTNLALTADSAEVVRVSAAFGLADWLDRPVAELSHGIRQRTSIARAVARSPRVLLIDEPEGGLDDAASKLWAEFVQGCVTDQRMTIIIAAHRPEPLAVRTQAIQLVSTLFVRECRV
jgi:ABC-type multidrug transport system ATPase subunit